MKLYAYYNESDMNTFSLTTDIKKAEMFKTVIEKRAPHEIVIIKAIDMKKFLDFISIEFLMHTHSKQQRIKILEGLV